jgi:hypothetical protein
MHDPDMEHQYKPESPVASSFLDDHGSAQIDEKKLLRKIDLRVLPMLVLIYIAAFLDRCVYCTLCYQNSRLIYL